MLVQAGNLAELASPCFNECLFAPHADFLDGLEAVGNEGGADDEEFSNPAFSQFREPVIRVGREPWVATEAGLDVARFSSDIDSGPVTDAVQWQSDSAERSGVNATPTFFVNGTKMQQAQSPEQFVQFLLDALNANP